MKIGEQIIIVWTKCCSMTFREKRQRVFDLYLIYESLWLSNSELFFMCLCVCMFLSIYCGHNWFGFDMRAFISMSVSHAMIIRNSILSKN